MGRPPIFAVAIAVVACSAPALPPDHPKDHPPYVQPEDEFAEVEISTTEPDRSLYDLAGDVAGHGSAANVAEAVAHARAALRTEAQRLHATVAVVDMSNGDRAVFRGTSVRTFDVVLNGRAFRKKHPRP